MKTHRTNAAASSTIKSQFLTVGGDRLNSIYSYFPAGKPALAPLVQQLLQDQAEHLHRSFPFQMLAREHHIILASKAPTLPLLHYPNTIEIHLSLLSLLNIPTDIQLATFIPTSFSELIPSLCALSTMNQDRFSMGDFKAPTSAHGLFTPPKSTDPSPKPKTTYLPPPKEELLQVRLQEQLRKLRAAIPQKIKQMSDDYYVMLVQDLFPTPDTQMFSISLPDAASFIKIITKVPCTISAVENCGDPGVHQSQMSVLLEYLDEEYERLQKCNKQDASGIQDNCWNTHVKPAFVFVHGELEAMKEITEGSDSQPSEASENEPSMTEASTSATSEQSAQDPVTASSGDSAHQKQGSDSSEHRNVELESRIQPSWLASFRWPFWWWPFHTQASTPPAQESEPPSMESIDPQIPKPQGRKRKSGKTKSPNH